MDKNDFIDSNFSVRLEESQFTSIKIMKTLDMLNFKDFPDKNTDTTNLEICDDGEMVNKIYVAFFCHQNETSIVEFGITTNTTHPPLKFYMKKFCNRGKIPELNVLMTTNKSNYEDKKYIMHKSVLNNPEELPIVFEDQVFFYVSSEIGKQILIYPKISFNDTGVTGYLTGRGTFGLFILNFFLIFFNF